MKEGTNLFSMKSSTRLRGSISREEIPVAYQEEILNDKANYQAIVVVEHSTFEEITRIVLSSSYLESVEKMKNMLNR